MFTTGSKLFLGATAVTIVAAIVVGGSIGGSTGLMGTVGLVTVAAVFAFLAGINLYTRDGNVSAQQEGALTTSAAAQHTSGRSVWPLVTAVGAAGVVVGTVSHPVVFKVAVVVLLAAVVEWMVQGWSERASADSKFNASVRKRILNPLEARCGLQSIFHPGYQEIHRQASRLLGDTAIVVKGEGGERWVLYREHSGRSEGGGYTPQPPMPMDARAGSRSWHAAARTSSRKRRLIS